MTLSQTTREAELYLNPVYAGSCPDPFILKFAGEYWCYSTGFAPDGRAFGVLHSRDLVRWRELGGAMELLPGSADCYWAPEVIYEDGRFLMYYSVGDGVEMHIRVAVAERPEGPFVDVGRRLTTEEFAIDAHVFVDTDGTRYLFYATDFLTHTHIGTGTVRDLMLDPFTLAGEPRPVTRARYDWQVYDPARKEKGGVRWHTVEGPFVLRRKDLYYQLFSGGNWQNVTYGVSYAVSESLARTDEWEQASDGERVLPILRTLPGRVIGPGHNSVVRGPDNRQLFCVYHRWTEQAEARVLSIDRLEWVGQRMSVLGPSTGPVRAPLLPSVADFFDAPPESGLGELWECRRGLWRVQGGEAVQESAEGEAEALCRTRAESFTSEVSLRAGDEWGADGSFGVGVRDDEGRLIFQYSILPQTLQVVISWISEQGGHTETLALPEQFNPRAFHLLRIEADGARLKASLDEGTARWQGQLSATPARLSLSTHQATANFKGFALTAGWENLFEEEGAEMAAHGWQNPSGDGSWHIREGQLRCSAEGDGRTAATRGPKLRAYEMVVNVRFESGRGEGARVGFYPALDENGRGSELALERALSGRWVLQATDGGSHRQTFALPEDFDPFVYQQFRLTKERGQILVAREADVLGRLELQPEMADHPTGVGLFVERASAAFDMVRVTEIAESVQGQS